MTTVQKRTQDFLSAIAPAEFGLLELTREVRFARVRQVLIQTHGNQCAAARKLQIHRNSLSRILQEMKRAGYQIDGLRKH